MKSKKILLTSIIVIIALATIYAYAKEDSVFYRFGELTKDQIEISNMQDLEINGITADDNIVVQANDFVIGAKYLENLTDQNRLTGKNTKEAKNMALNQLIVKYSLYYYAINEGFLIDDETIKKSIEENREIIKTADNYSDFTTFLEGPGMSEDEYWDSQFDLYKLN